MPNTRTKRRRTVIAPAIMSCLLLGAAGCSEDQNRGVPVPAPVAPTEEAAADTYPLKTCVVSGEPLDQFGDPVVEHFDGREVRFCCTDCADAFRQAPAQYITLLDAPARKEGRTDGY